MADELRGNARFSAIYSTSDVIDEIFRDKDSDDDDISISDMSVGSDCEEAYGDESNDQQQHDAACNANAVPMDTDDRNNVAPGSSGGTTTAATDNDVDMVDSRSQQQQMNTDNAMNNEQIPDNPAVPDDHAAPPIPDQVAINQQNVDVDDNDNVASDSDDGNHDPNQDPQPQPQPRQRINPHIGAYRQELWMADFQTPSGPLVHDEDSPVGEIFEEMLTGTYDSIFVIMKKL